MPKAKDDAIADQTSTEAIAVPETEQSIEAVSDAQSEKEAQIQTWKNLNIAYCSTCGEKLATNLEGLPTCPIKKADCDRNS